jgi:hypothetical protein
MIAKKPVVIIHHCHRGVKMVITLDREAKIGYNV